jgi:hypothetical protein
VLHGVLGGETEDGCEAERGGDRDTALEQVEARQLAPALRDVLSGRGRHRPEATDRG